jgi:Mg2+/Co2+ transporter CorB
VSGVGQSELIVYSAILVVLILFATFFSAAETALMAVNRYQLLHKARLRKRYAIYLLQLLKRPDRVLGVILIGSTFSNILASSLATLLAFHFFGNRGAVFAAILLTFVILICAEMMPKTLAAIYPDRVGRWVALPIRLMLKLFYPIVWMANAVSNGLLRLMRVHVTQRSIEPLSREELRSIVYDTSGKISRQYQNMLLGILDLSQLTVDDVMIPRGDVRGVDIELPWHDVMSCIYQSKEDWLPVYRENINQLVGVLQIRDILQLALTQTQLSREHIDQFLQEPYFVPEGTLLSVQLSYFQQSQNKVAFIVDEYGEIQGLLTLNDILEEIVGDFTSSLSTGKRIREEKDGGYLVEGAVSVREFNRVTGWELPLHGPRTMNGLIIEHLEALPHAGTTVLIAGFPIELIHVKENRVKLAKVFPLMPEKVSGKIELF